MYFTADIDDHKCLVKVKLSCVFLPPSNPGSSLYWSYKKVNITFLKMQFYSLIGSYDIMYCNTGRYLEAEIPLSVTFSADRGSVAVQLCICTSKTTIVCKPTSLNQVIKIRQDYLTIITINIVFCLPLFFFFYLVSKRNTQKKTADFGNFSQDLLSS